MFNLYGMRLMRLSILNVSSVVLFLTAFVIFYFNPFNSEEFNALFLPVLLWIASILLFIFDLIVKLLVKKRGNYVFTQVVLLEIILGTVIFFCF